MKPVKSFVLALLLFGALSANVFAGEIPTPPSPPPVKAITTTDDGTTPISDPYTQQSGDIAAETSDYLFFEALAALLSVY